MPRTQTPAQPAFPTLDASLFRMTVDDLKWYAGALQTSVPNRKGELVDILKRALSDPASLQRLVARLTPVQQHVVAEVAHRLAGRYNVDLLEAKYPDSQPPKLSRNYGYFFSSHSQKENASPYDLFFFYSYELGRYMPSDLAATLRSLVPPPPDTELRSHAEPPSVPKLPKYHGQLRELATSENERAIAHDLSATLYLIQQGKAAISPATRLPTLPTLRQLRQVLLQGDYFTDEYERAEDAIRPLALIVLVQAARWAAPTAAGNKLELTKAGQALLGVTLGPQHIREVWERWLKSDVLDELSRIRNIKGQQAKGTRLTKPAERRAKLPVLLGVFPASRWVTMDEALRYLRAEGQLPAIERGGGTNLGIGAYNTYYSESDESYGGKYWDVITGSYLRATLWEYVATLGLIEIAYTHPDEAPHQFGDLYYLDDDALSRYDGLVAMRLTNLGAYVLGKSDTYTAPDPIVPNAAPALKVLPNLDVVVTDAARFPPNDRALLERIAAPQSQDVYHLSRELLLEAVGSGLELEQIKQFLAARSGQSADEFPQIVRVFFDDLERRMSALSETGTLLAFESGDAFLLTELANNPALRAIVQLGTLGDHQVLFVPEDQAAAVRRQLKKLGYLPKKG